MKPIVGSLLTIKHFRVLRRPSVERRQLRTKSKEFFRTDENAGFLEEILREPRSTQNRRDTHSSFFHDRPDVAVLGLCLG